MKPLRGRAIDGRANPKGISYLYLATDLQTAISEVRPALGSYVSVCQFRVKDRVRIVDCSSAPHPMEALMAARADEVDESYGWSSINEAFSEPVERIDDVANYAPTQLLAECFKGLGYKGILYRSAFSTTGRNVVLFTPGLARPSDPELHRVTCVTFVAKKVTRPKLL